MPSFGTSVRQAAPSPLSIALSFSDTSSRCPRSALEGKIEKNAQKHADNELPSVKQMQQLPVFWVFFTSDSVLCSKPSNVSPNFWTNACKTPFMHECTGAAACSQPLLQLQVQGPFPTLKMNQNIIRSTAPQTWTKLRGASSAHVWFHLTVNGFHHDRNHICLITCVSVDFTPNCSLWVCTFSSANQVCSHCCLV